MTKLKLKDLSQAMQKIDICMMATHDANGALESRPMSNNRDVEFKGDTYFFALEDSSVVRHLKKDPHVCLSYESDGDLYISLSGEGYTNQNKEDFKEHWVPDLDKWFEDGIDTPGLTMIHINGEHMHYWQGRSEGEIRLKDVA